MERYIVSVRLDSGTELHEQCHDPAPLVRQLRRKFGKMCKVEAVPVGEFLREHGFEGDDDPIAVLREVSTC